MKTPLLTRLATLAIFIVLMTGFVAYKAGAFAGAEVYIDSPGKDSLNPEVMIPSSKLMILTDDPHTKQDTQNNLQQNDQRANSPAQQNAPDAAPAPKSNTNQSATPANSTKTKVYMGSSKSAPVFTPTQTNTVTITDSTSPK